MTKPNERLPRWRGRLWVLGSLLRLPLVGWSLALPVMGALSARDVHYDRLAVALVVAVPFHIVYAMLNDLADLGVDRGDPRKAGRPLVSGAVRPAHAAVLVVAAVPLAFTLDIVLLGTDPGRLLVLGVALAGVAGYDWWSKRTAFPPLMDLAQGVGAAAMAHYGAAAAGQPTGVTYLVDASIALFIVLINGVHAGLRDLSSDFAFGARTTPIMFGARPTGGQPFVPKGLVAYAWTLQAVFVGVTTVPVLVSFARGECGVTVTACAVAFMGAAGALLWRSLDDSRPMSSRYPAASLQMLVLVGMLATLACLRRGSAVALAVFLTAALPVAAKRIWALVARRGRRAPGEASSTPRATHSTAPDPAPGSPG